MSYILNKNVIRLCHIYIRWHDIKTCHNMSSEYLIYIYIIYILYIFIHYEDLYSAPSRLLLRSAPDPSTAEKDSFEARIERFRVDSGMQSQRQREPIPEGGANHWEGAILLSSSAGKRDHEHAPLSRAERATTQSTQGRAAEVA